MGNDGEIFKLDDGSLWEVKYEYEYLYEYYPKVIICPSSGKLVINGKNLNVERVKCEEGHWIQEVFADGEIIQLENGSMWKVDLADTIDSRLWLPVSNVLICGYKIINVDDNESVHATKIR
jgi:hypothetical protein